MSTRHPIILVLALCVGVGVSAQAQNTTHSAMPAGQQTAGAATPGEDEREALGILSAINTSEINAANLALQKQVQGGARDYATRMVKEHTDNNQKIAKWQPDTKTPPVLEHLQTTRHHVADHLSSAKALQATGKNVGAL